jgi:hypothetical protein
MAVLNFVAEDIPLEVPDQDQDQESDNDNQNVVITSIAKTMEQIHTWYEKNPNISIIPEVRFYTYSSLAKLFGKDGRAIYNQMAMERLLASPGVPWSSEITTLAHRVKWMFGGAAYQDYMRACRRKTEIVAELDKEIKRQWDLYQRAKNGELV